MGAPTVAGKREKEIANPLFEYLLRIGDDRVVLGHRTSEWCGHGPMLEEDIALANIALDFVGQGSSLLALAGATEGRGRDEDDAGRSAHADPGRGLLLASARGRARARAVERA